jgi:hypothetical protein
MSLEKINEITQKAENWVKSQLFIFANMFFVQLNKCKLFSASFGSAFDCWEKVV